MTNTQRLNQARWTMLAMIHIWMFNNLINDELHVKVLSLIMQLISTFFWLWFTKRYYDSRTNN